MGVQITEAEVFSRLIDASNPTLTPHAAAGILQLGYSDEYARPHGLTRAQLIATGLQKAMSA